MNILLGLGLVLIGVIIGMTLMTLTTVSKITEMQSLIDASRKALADAEDKITDLKNNIELLVNNSKNKKIKELVTDGKSEN